jgi:hypothetical protein
MQTVDFTSQFDFGEAQPVHQVRHVWLGNTQNLSNFALFQLLVFEDFEDVVSNLGTRQRLVGILEAQIREDVSGAFFELNWFSSFRTHVPTPVLRPIRQNPRSKLGFP